METSFGFWIKRRRKSLDLTQQELARRIGCSPSLIFKIESDERRPSRQIAELEAQFTPDRYEMIHVRAQSKTFEALVQQMLDS